MARRIDIELTSTRDDGSWTWRAAGARQPKGVVASSVLPGSPSVGDVLRVEVEVGLDGTEITAVLADRAPRAEPERLQLLGRELRDDELVTSKLVGKRGRDRDDGDGRGRGRGRRDGRGGGGDRGRRDGPGRPSGPSGREGRDGRPGDRSARHPRDTPGRSGGGRDEGARKDRPRRRPEDAKPRPKRLRPQRTHRRAVLDTLEVHERPVAEEVLRGGMAAVRQAVEKQNAQARAEGRPEIDPAQLEALAERLLPRLRAADWRDRAEAALADLDELDLRDLRTVVAGAESSARDDESKALATQLREGLSQRIEADQAAWLAEMAQVLDEGRVVRALRVSSRPPKAGSFLPPDLAARLVEATSASLTADTPTDRWSTVLDALSLSPIHGRVAPVSVPAEPSDELKAVVAAAGTQVPLVAQALGVEPAPAPRRRGPGKGGANRAKPVPPPPPSSPTPEAAPEAPQPAEAAVETVTAEAPGPDTAPVPDTAAVPDLDAASSEASAPTPEVTDTEVAETETPTDAAASQEPVEAAPAPEAVPEPEPEAPVADAVPTAEGLDVTVDAGPVEDPGPAVPTATEPAEAPTEAGPGPATEAPTDQAS